MLSMGSAIRLFGSRSTRWGRAAEKGAPAMTVKPLTAPSTVETQVGLSSAPPRRDPSGHDGAMP